MKYDITDMAILMIVKFDSIDRLENTLVVIDYILENFKTNLYVWEIGTFNNGIFRRVMDKKIHYEFHQDYDPILHRTKYINQMVKKTKEEYVAIWDVDIIVPAEQISQAVNMLRNGADFVYPYERYFYDTSFAIRNAFYRTRDISLLDSYKPFMNEMYSPNNKNTLSDDWKKITFKDIKHPTKLGKRYRFSLEFDNPDITDLDKSIWITLQTTAADATESVVIRRCDTFFVFLSNDEKEIHYEPVCLDSDFKYIALYRDETITVPQAEVYAVMQYNQYTKNVKINDRFFVGSVNMLDDEYLK